VNYVDESPDAAYTRFKVDAWYNRTRFDGDTDNPSKYTFHVIDRVEAALEDAFQSSDVSFRGDTDGALSSAGTRATVTYGDDDWTHLSLGADLRYAKRRITEDYSIVDNDNSSNSTDFATNLPKADLLDPGFFTELSLPLHDYWTTTIGARLDWVHMKASADEVRSDTSLVGVPGNLAQNDVLYAFYLVNDVDLLSNWKARFGFGQAQRFPTLTERYADGVFLGIIQSGFSRVIGDPDLDKERAWQIDASLKADYCCWHGHVSAYHAWVLDYVTYYANIISNPEGARLLRATNTDLATLAGFEAYGECDLTCKLTAFGSLQYIDGRDRIIHAPLSTIAPLEGRAGLRLHDACGGDTWGIELGARIVDDQDRLGTLRQVAPLTGVVPVELPTGGFTTAYLRGYYNVNERLHFIAGIDNLFDRNYLEHLDLRLPADPAHGIPATRVLAPGFTPYAGVEWTY
jgi:outer membrane receptor protein involved in Fe transport